MQHLDIILRHVGVDPAQNSTTLADEIENCEVISGVHHDRR